MADDIVKLLLDRCFGGGETRRVMSLAAAEIERLRAEIDVSYHRLEDIVERVQAVAQYVEHRETCQSLLGGGRPCSCGLSDLLRSSHD